MNDYELEEENYRRRTLRGLAVSVGLFGFAVAGFGIVAAITVISEANTEGPEELDGFAETAAYAAVATGAYWIAGAVLIAAGMITAAAVTGPARITRRRRAEFDDEDESFPD